MESFKPTVLALNRENKADLICPWDWGLPRLIKPRHSAATLVLGEAYNKGRTWCNGYCGMEPTWFMGKRWGSSYMGRAWCDSSCEGGVWGCNHSCGMEQECFVGGEGVNNKATTFPWNPLPHQHQQESKCSLLQTLYLLEISTKYFNKLNTYSTFFLIFNLLLWKEGNNLHDKHIKIVYIFIWWAFLTSIHCIYFCSSHFITISAKKIYLIGGSISIHGGTVQDVDCFDIEKRTWSQPFSLPKGMLLWHEDLATMLLSF